MKIIMIEEKNLHIFWTAWKISRKFSVKILHIITSKDPQNILFWKKRGRFFVLSKNCMIIWSKNKFDEWSFGSDDNFLRVIAVFECVNTEIKSESFTNFIELTSTVILYFFACSCWRLVLRIDALTGFEQTLWRYQDRSNKTSFLD